MKLYPTLERLKEGSKILLPFLLLLSLSLVAASVRVSIHLCLSPPLSLSNSLSSFLYISKSLFTHCLFFFFYLYGCLLNSPIAFCSFHNHFTSGHWQLTYLSRSSSLTFSLSLFWPEGGRSKCRLDEQGKQFVYPSLLLFPYRPTGGYAAFIVGEMSHKYVLTHVNI